MHDVGVSMIEVLWFLGGIATGVVLGVFVTVEYIARCKRYIKHLESRVSWRPL